MLYTNVARRKLSAILSKVILTMPDESVYKLLQIVNNELDRLSGLLQEMEESEQ